VLRLPSIAETARKATWNDVLAYPEDIRVEVLAGEIVTTPAPLPRHSNAQRALGRFIGGPFHDDDGFGGPGGWWILLEVDIRFEVHEIVRPDVAGWRRIRLPDAGDLRPIEVVPDWICEVLSPSTASRDRVAKRALYARCGVAYYWMLDPESRTLEALKRNADGGWGELGAWDEHAVTRIEPFEAVELLRRCSSAYRPTRAVSTSKPPSTRPRWWVSGPFAFAFHSATYREAGVDFE
jgi:Uma2 family endonuclease